MDWFRSLPDYRRKIYLLLIVAILLTLPCYCIGLALLILAPEETAPPSATPVGSGISGEVLPRWALAPGPGLAWVQPLQGGRGADPEGHDGASGTEPDRPWIAVPRSPLRQAHHA